MSRPTSPTIGWRPLFLAPEAFLCWCSQEGLLDLKNEKYVVSISYLGRTQLLLVPAIVFILEYLSTWGQTPAAQFEAYLSPATVSMNEV